MMRNLALVLIGFALFAVVHIVWSWLAARPRRFNLGRDYFDPCGPQCKAKRMSKIGWRERSEEVIRLQASRLHRVLQRASLQPPAKP